MKKLNNHKKALATLLFQAQSTEEMMYLLDDLLTQAEIVKLYERVKILDCLDQKMSQRETFAKTGSAIATVSRGAEVMQKEGVQLPEIIRRSRTQLWWRTLFWCA